MTHTLASENDQAEARGQRSPTAPPSPEQNVKTAGAERLKVATCVVLHRERKRESWVR